MNDDQLRDRIARLDPLGDARAEPVTSPQSRALLEEIMSTPTESPTESAQPPFELEPRRNRPAWWKLAGAAAAVIAVVAVGVAALAGGDDDPQLADPAPTTGAPLTSAPPKLKVIELSTGIEDTMAMCIQITPELVADTQVAFKGTVDTVDSDVITLTIDEAYKGTDAQVATLVAPAGMEALIGGFPFEVGQQYYITAFDGVVNYCGFSGPVTPELQAVFDQAFPAG